MTACTASRYEVLSFFFDGVPDPNAPVRTQPEEPQARNLPVRPFVPPPVIVHMHEPYTQRRCDACHKGAGSAARRTSGAFAINTMSELLLPADKLCATCHQPNPGAYQHAPALLGDCSRCHTAHSSRFPHLLLQEKSAALCAPCHAAEEMPTRELHVGFGDRDCAECHDPHGSDRRFLLRPEPPPGPPAPPAVVEPPAAAKEAGR
jgi:predicted CXXCH cytochrome family protein